MRKILIVLVILAGLALAAELVAPSVAAARIDEAIKARSSNEVGVDAKINSFPFVTRLLLTGKIDHTTVTLTQVAGQDLTFASVRYDVDGLVLDREKLFQQKIQVRSITRAVATATIDTAAIADAYGLDETKVDQFAALIGPRLKAAIPQELIPCSPDVNVKAGRVELSCTFTEIPPIINKALAAN